MENYADKIKKINDKIQDKKPDLFNLFGISEDEICPAKDARKTKS